MTFPTRCRRSSLHAAPLDAAVGRRVGACDLGGAIAAVLLALALLVAGAPAAGHDRDASRVAASHAIADGSAPSLHVVARGIASMAPHAPRRVAGDGSTPSVATAHFALADAEARSASSPRSMRAPHSVLAAGFDATAPPA